MGAIGFAPALVASTVTIGLWLATGVGIDSIALFSGYEAIFVLLPGWLVVSWLVCWPLGAPGWIALALAVGQAMLAGAFVVTAALGVRGLLVLYPVPVLGVAAVAIMRGRLRPSVNTDAWPRREQWAVCGIWVAVVVALALQSWTDPLPGTVPSVSYGLDDVWSLSLAAEARHHWPLGDPTVAGTTLSYHWFAAVSAASVNQVTGLALPLVFLRLYLVPLLAAAVLGLVELGWVIARRPWAGPLAAALALFAGEIDLDPMHGLTFGNQISNDAFGLSPTFLAGVVFWLALLLVLVARFELPAVARGWRWWLVVAVLLVAAGTAKATTLPVLLAGLALWVVVSAFRERPGPSWGSLRPWFGVLVLGGLVYVLLYRNAGGAGLALDPPGGIRQTRGLQPILAAFHGHVLAEVALWPLAVVVGLVAAYGGALVGIPWAVRGRRIAASQLLMLSLLVSSVVPFLLFSHPGFSEAYFIQYGVIAAAAVSAVGLCRLAQDARGRWPPGASWLLAGAGILLVGSWLLARAKLDQGRWFPALDLVVAGLATLFVAGSWLAPKARWRWLWPAALAFVVVAAMNTPLDVAPHLVNRLFAGEPPYVQSGRQVTPNIAAGLAWLRHRSSPDAVLAVNNYSTQPLRAHRPPPPPDEYIYSALAERRVFLEGWIYADRSFRLGESAVLRRRIEPFPERRLLNDAVFLRADRNALSILVHRHHVRYLVVDRLHAPATPRLARLAARVYSNRDITIYAVDPSTSSG